MTIQLSIDARRLDVRDLGITIGIVGIVVGVVVAAVALASDSMECGPVSGADQACTAQQVFAAAP